MSDENTTVESLDDFATEFFNPKKVETPPAEEPKDEVKEEDAPEVEETVEEDTLAEETEVEEEPVKEPKKISRTQERINQLLEKERVALEGKAEALERERSIQAKLDEALAKLAESTKTNPVKSEKVVDGSPKPTDTNEDGSEKYPLGEFDSQYIQDLVTYKLDEQDKVREAKEAETKTKRQREAQEAELLEQWNEKLVPAKERYPDFDDKVPGLAAAFEGVDETYGEYIAATVMDMEYGPDVFYYLANNLDEAKKIVMSGAKKATIALGRLEAKFAIADEEKQRARPRVSEAPPPPPQNKGSDVAKPAIRGDEKDLDSFSAEFFRGGR